MEQWDRAAIVEWLEAHLGKKRMEHVLGTEAECRRLARIHGADEEQAALAGLVHDCAKNLKDAELIAAAQGYGIPMDEHFWHDPGLLHAPVGAEVARRQFGINDDAILRAVELHTLGAQDMTSLDIILYVADMIEPTRDFNGVQAIRKISSKDLNGTLINALGQMFQYLSKGRRWIHPTIVETWNGALERSSRKGK